MSVNCWRQTDHDRRHYDYVADGVETIGQYADTGGIHAIVITYQNSHDAPSKRVALISAIRRNAPLMA